MSSLPPIDDWPRFSGHELLDQHGTTVGTITDVVYDGLTERPKWGVVSPGRLKSNHYVPLTPPAYVSDDGKVVVPYEKTTIMHAPKAKGHHVITPLLQRELEHHYALAD